MTKKKKSEPTLKQRNTLIPYSRMNKHSLGWSGDVTFDNNYRAKITMPYAELWKPPGEGDIFSIVVVPITFWTGATPREEHEIAEEPVSFKSSSTADEFLQSVKERTTYVPGHTKPNPA